MILKDKVIIVTGGSGLIGQCIINDLKKKGAIAINAEISVDTDLSQGNVHCDITSEESVNDLINIVIERYLKIDGLVNNAYPRTKDWGTKFEEIPLLSWKKNVDMQLNSVFLLCQKALSQMVKQQYGSIVNIGSIYGVVGNDFTYIIRRIDGEYFKVDSMLNMSDNYRFVPDREQILEAMKYDAELRKTSGVDRTPDAPPRAPRNFY